MTKDVLNTAFAALLQDIRPPDIPLPALGLADKMAAGGVSSAGKQQQIRSVFDRLGSGRKTGESHLLPLRELSPDRDSVFPGSKAADPWKGSSALKEKIRQTAEKIDPDSETGPEVLLFALERYGWCLPSAAEDVSFYDRARIRAALAVCLREIDPLPENWESCGDPAGILVGGEISGIQKFIYTITDKEAAKSLRGRSFFIQVLTESVLRFMLRELGIPYTAVIYSGGGNFYLLAPRFAAEKIPGIRKAVTEKLLRHFGTDLYLTLGSAEIAFREFKQGCFGEPWSRMHQDIGRQKNRRYRELGNDIHALLFTPEPHGGNREKVCDLCGQEKESTKAKGEQHICRGCEAFADDFGKNLPDASFVRFTLGEPQTGEAGDIDDALAEFGVGIDLLDRRGTVIGEKAAFQGDRAYVWSLDGSSLPGSDLPVSVRSHFIANKRPDLLFDEMQRSAETGIPRLGVLRMDVDNMGMLFQKGFGKDLSVVRLAALSQQLSLFFEGYIRELCGKYRDKDGNDEIYIVYTGGDDVFVLGHWIKITELAEEINREFHAYTGGNPDISISGGMTFIHGKYPLRQAALDAGEEEERAKDYHNGEKNAFAFLGEAFSWEDFAGLREKKDLLKKIINAGGPKSILQTLQRLDEQKQEAGNREYGRWLWMGDYQFARMKKQYKKEKFAEDLDLLHDRIQENYYQNIHHWGKAARWAQLELRVTEKGD